MAWRSESATSAAQIGEEVVQGCCFLCPNNACGSYLYVRNGTVTKILPKMNPHNLGKMCGKGMSILGNLYSEGRVTKPLVRRNPKKGIGIDPQWEEVSWNEGLQLVADNLRRLKATDPRKFTFMSFKTAHMTYYAAFTAALGSPNFRPFSASLFCGNNVHPMCYMVHGTFHDAPDLDYTKLLITFGTQYSSVGGIDTMYSAVKVPEARKRGMKFIVVDPVQSPAAAKADVWVPIRPGTDMLLALGMLNLLVNDYKMYDTDFLKSKTNAPYLVDSNERYIRDKKSDKPLVWDATENRARPYDLVKDSAILGSYEVDGVKCKPGFEFVREGVKKWTPDEVSKITTVPSRTVRELAKEWGETASIGSTIDLNGHTMPLRPVALHWYRGISAHKNSTLAGFSLAMLKEVVGAVDVPGGTLGEPYEEGYVLEGPDGLLTTSPHAHGIPPPYPPRKVEKPQTIWSFELLPTAAVSETIMALSYMYPEKYPLPYKIDTLFTHHANVAKTSFNPQQMEMILKDVPFHVSFNFEIDETAEYADVIIPALHNLETLTPWANVNNLHPGMHEKYFLASFPAAKPPFEAPYDQATDIMDYLIDIADRAGFIEDLNGALNLKLHLEGDYELKDGERYTWKEISDKFLRAKFGDEHSLSWFQEHGFITLPRKIEESYPGAFKKPRIPFYFEFMARAREDVEKTINELGYKDWELSAYKAVPDWQPCASHLVTDPDFDLYMINRKASYLAQSQSGNNPLMGQLVSNHRGYDLIIHREAAARKGIQDGDFVWVESTDGVREKGRAKVSESVHPDVLVSTGIAGFWAKKMLLSKGQGFDFNRFMVIKPEKVDFGNSAFDSCVKVKVTKVEAVPVSPSIAS